MTGASGPNRHLLERYVRVSHGFLVDAEDATEAGIVDEQ